MPSSGVSHVLARDGLIGASIESIHSLLDKGFIAEKLLQPSSPSFLISVQHPGKGSMFISYTSLTMEWILDVAAASMGIRW